MIKCKWLFFFTIVLSMELVAQQLTPSVISSSGGFYSNASGMLSFTTGELAAVETYTSPSSILTQGFQQPWDFGTFVIDHPTVTFTFGIFPNPSDGNINLLTESEETADLTVRVTDLLGRQVMKTEFYHERNQQLNSVDLTTALPGIYFLTLIVKTRDFIEADQTVKIEIIR